jgi:hypothetical protein
MVCTTLICCSKKPIEEPQIDFSVDKYYTPAEIRSSKFNIECGSVAYWEGKKIKLEGFVFQGNVDTANNFFALYESNDVRTTNRVTIYYKNQESSKIDTFLLKNSNKFCQLSATCSSDSVFLNSCTKAIIFNLLKIEDLKFK